MFFYHNLVFADLSNNTRVIIPKKNILKDFSINIDKETSIENNSMIDPITKKNINGYVICDDVYIELNVENYDIDLNSITVENYYYRYFNGKYIKIRNMDSKYEIGEKYQVIPKHTFEMLKNSNRLRNRLFVISFDYYVKDEELKNKLLLVSTASELEDLKKQYDYKIYDNYDCYVKQNYKLYFQYVTENEFNAYKELRDIRIETTRELRPKAVEK